MYERFFKLIEKPFNLTPDTKYFFLSTKHKEAYAQLIYGTQENVGFMVVIGEIGTGKTMITRAFLNQIQENLVPALIINPALNEVELLQTINRELNVFHESGSRADLLDALYQYLLEQRKIGKRVVLIIDEAQTLSPSVFEQLRMISNFETETEKLISIILVGQPELSRILKQNNLRQLNQRISIRSYLNPLTFSETQSYILHRLRVAGGTNNIRITRWAFFKIYRLSKGIPRLINIICDRALLAGYTQGTNVINGRIVHESAQEVTGKTFMLEYHKFRPPVASYLTLALGLILTFYFFLGQPDNLQGAMDQGVQMMTKVLYSGNQMNSSNGTARVVPDPESIQKILNGTHEGFDFNASNSNEISVPENDRHSIQLAKAEEPPERTVGLNIHSKLEEKMEEAVLKEEPEVLEDSKEDRSLTEYLQQWDEGESKVEAINHLLALWHHNQFVIHSEKDKPVMVLANSRGFDCLHENMNLDSLKEFNLPAILGVRVPGTEETRYVSVLKYHQEEVYIDLALKHAIPQDTLREIFTGEIYIFWRDYEKLPVLMKQKQKGKKVVWLQKSLEKLGYFQRKPTGYFGILTKKAVARFQKETGLMVDGIIGSGSKIVLYNRLNSYHTPLLSRS